jgi:hypothetical protein
LRVVSKLIPIDELLEIVTEAGLLHQRDFYSVSLSKLVIQGGDPFADLSTAFDLAATLDIPEERIRAVLANRYPSVGEQLDALEGHGAVATTFAVAHTYKTELLKALRLALPSFDFDGTVEQTGRVFDQAYLEHKWRRDYTVQLSLLRETEATPPRPPKWRSLVGLAGTTLPTQPERRRIPLAAIDVGHELLPYGGGSDHRLRAGTRLYLIIEVSSGVFLKQCTTVLSALRERFEKHNGLIGHEVRYDYVVE